MNSVRASIVTDIFESSQYYTTLDNNYEAENIAFTAEVTKFRTKLSLLLFLCYFFKTCISSA